MVTVALAAAASSAGGGFPRFGAGCARADFRSQGRPIRAELCRAANGSGAAVVVLHGCGGFSTFDHRIVTSLPRYGISTLDVDYFALTPPPGHKGFCDGGGGVDPFPVWTRTALDAATALRRTPGVRHVGIVGWSLGGGVAVQAALAAHAAGTPLGALAGFSTGAFDAASSAPELPPTILLSGGRTDAIPLQETLPLYRALRAAHVPSSLYVWPDGSHAWPGRQGAAGIAHAAAFLRRHLRAPG